MDDDVYTGSDNRKSGTLVVFIILFILVMGAGCSIYYLYTQGYFTETEEPIIEMVKIYIKPIDYYTKNLTSVNYRLYEGQKIETCLNDAQQDLFLENETLFMITYPEINVDLLYLNNKQYCYTAKIVPFLNSTGILSEGLNEFNLKKETIYYLHYFSKDYYANQEIWLGVSEPIYVNGTTIDKENVYEIFAHPIEDNLNISIFGEVKSESDNYIRVNLQGTKELRHIYVCWLWSFGVISIKSNLPEYYLPQRLNLKADRCFKTEQSISINTPELSFDFNITTGSLIEGDYIKVYIVDEDRFLNDENQLIYDFEDFDKKDVGAPDFEKIKYINN